MAFVMQRYEMSTLIQFKAPKTVTNETKYPKTVDDDLVAFMNPSAMKIEDIATAGIGTPRLFVRWNS
jgi:hypothetical protein